MNLIRLLEQSKLSFSEFWMVRDARERTILAVAALVIFAGLVFLLFIDPALSGRKQLNKNLPLLRQQVAQMQALSKEAAALNAIPPAPLIAMSNQNVEAALARNNLKPQSVTLTGDFAKVQLVSVSFTSTLNWLDDMQKTVRLSVVDANVVALDQPDMINATFTLRQPSRE
jgi:general secretion pathway protein M